MASLNEAASNQSTQMAAILDTGLETLGLNETITFVKYVQKVLPIDGYIFWVRGDLVGQGDTFQSVGSLHYSTDLSQEETITQTTNNVIFTAEYEVRVLNSIAPTVLYLATFNDIKFAFSTRGKYYRAADAYHYTGTAVQSDMLPQIVDDLSIFNSRDPIVSNSLPLWLQLNEYSPIYPTFSNPVMLYPSFLVPTNLNPPFAAVHIKPNSLRGLSGAPAFSRRYSQSQLVSETVDITIYGLHNDLAQDFLACVNQFTLDYGTFGIMNIPVLRDEKRPQVEIGALAQMKTVTFEINYLQSRCRDVARQLIKSAPVTYRISEESF